MNALYTKMENHYETQNLETVTHKSEQTSQKEFKI